MKTVVNNNKNNGINKFKNSGKEPAKKEAWPDSMLLLI